MGEVVYADANAGGVVKILNCDYCWVTLGGSRESLLLVESVALWVVVLFRWWFERPGLPGTRRLFCIAYVSVCG